MKFFFYFYFICGSLCGQKLLSLEECLNLSQSHNAEIIFQNLNRQKIRNSEDQIKRSRAPEIFTSISNGLNGGRSIDPFSNSFVQRTVTYNSFSISGNFTIFNGFMLKNQILQSKINSEISEYQLAKIKKEVKIAVLLAYMNALIKQQQVSIHQENLNDVISQGEYIEEKIKEGILAKYNRTEYKAQLTANRYELIIIQNELKSSKNILKQLISLDEDFELEIPRMTELLSLNEIQDLHYYPLFNILDNEIISAQYSLAVAKSAKLPKISISAGLGTSYSSAAKQDFSYFKQLGYNFNQYLGLGISIPIYNKASLQITSAKIDEKIAITKKKVQIIELRQIIDALSIEINSLRERVNSSVANVEFQQILYNGAKERYYEGLISYINLNTYRLNFEKAKIQNMQDELEVYFKQKIMNIYLES